jgi:opine dehydrogenase
MNITLVGGGAITHNFIAMFSEAGHNVSLLTRSPDKWEENIVSRYLNEDGETLKTWNGKLTNVSSDPVDVITDAELIIFSLPVHFYFDTLKIIMPSLNKQKKIYLGSVYGQGGFNWMVKSLIKDDYPKLNYFSFGLVPWICRVSNYGSVGLTYGPKRVNTLSMRYKDDFSVLHSILAPSLCVNGGNGDLRLIDNFLSLTLSVDNQLIHITRLYGLMSQKTSSWLNESDVPYFYRDYDQFSSECLQRLDREFSLIRDKITEIFPCFDFTYLMDYLNQERLTYGEETPSILDSFVNSKTLGQIKTPVIFDGNKFVIDKNHRFFKDDIFNGIVIFKWYAEKLEINTPFLNKIIKWAEGVLSVNILENDNLIESKSLKTPEFYGYSLVESLND